MPLSRSPDWKSGSLSQATCVRRAFATLGHDPGAILLDAAASQMVDNIAHFRPQVGLLQAPCILAGGRLAAFVTVSWPFALLSKEPGVYHLDSHSAP